ncbi:MULTISPECIES: signal peptide peptidase SppA [Pseudoalteromonas]|uniref:Signal peptide peptidase SppA n=1 Tax=Pseudoalteromonas amylolytica TaxID=1859457 RepID=A0A1S1MWV3_9GAMM|nr:MULTISPECIES: signal peptide peptidase SppA [Pseudoalteromonas]OHU88248.1 signal peptide peptidase SppA [Pseudoalteromonas sp. JW3]OHU91691.1 signal peptide peptidase SppA [Pseudoalteromonas amylolytica]
MIGKFFKALWHGLNFSRRLVLNIIFFIIIVAAIIAIFSDKEEITVSENSVLRLNLNGYLVEELTYIDPLDAAFQDLSESGDEPHEILLDDVLEVINRAKKDDRIQVLWLDLENLYGGHLDKLEVITQALDEFKNADKKVIAHGSYYSQAQYYLAAHADTISLHPYGSVKIRGFSSYPLYFKDALDKLKVTQHIFRVGTYKSAIEPLIRNDMSDAAKEANRLWLGELWQQYKQEIADARPFGLDNFDETLDDYEMKIQAVKGDFAQYALHNGWVDELKTDQQLQSELIELVGLDKRGKTFNQISFDEYLEMIKPPVQFENPITEKVAVIVARGAIVDGKQKAGKIGGDSTAALLKRARLNDKVKAVVLRIDSGGGSMFASETIRNEILAIKAAGKPVVASMGSVAASGGYWIAASTNEIWAAPSTITGSIGVFGAILTFENSLKELGIHSDGVATTELNGMSIARGIDKQLVDIYQLSVENSYDKFISLVAQERNMTKEAVDKVAQGRVWTATQAKEFGLIDNLGYKKDAIEAAAKLANLDFYEVITIEQELSEKEQLIREFLGSATVKSALAGVAPDASVAKLASGYLSPITSQVEQNLDLLNQFNDPNGTYVRCLVCEVSF